jgi:hypothetical protein
MKPRLADVDLRNGKANVFPQITPAITSSTRTTTKGVRDEIEP